MVKFPWNNMKYMLRWRYDFLSNPTKYGQWDREANLMSDMACFNLKEGLVRASIEGKDIETREIKTLAEVDGHDFCLFQWMAIASGGSAFNLKGSHEMVKKNIGLKLVSRDKFIEVYKTGLVQTLDRPVEDKNFHYAAYGR
jgi:hypothetical protein